MRRLTLILKEYFIGNKSSLRRMVILGGNWLMIRALIIGILDICIKVPIFRRVLNAHDYGFMELAAVAVAFPEMFSTTGIEAMILREEDDFMDRLPGYWTIRFLRGIVLTFLLFCLAVPIAGYFEKPELVWLIRFLGLSIFFRGIAGFGREIRQRNMDFKTVAIFDSVSRLAVIFLSLVLLFLFRSYWALACYVVLVSIMMAITSYVMYPWRPRLAFSYSLFKSVAVFAGAMITLNILNYVCDKFDRVIIGKMFTMDNLGYYAGGYLLATIPLAYVANPLAPVLLSAFRKMREDSIRLRRAFFKSVAILAVCFSCGSLLLMVTGKFIVLLVMGENWLPVLPYFKILLIFCVLKGLSSPCSYLFVLKDKPWFITISVAVKTVFFIFLCYPLTKTFGAIGMAWSVVISTLMSSSCSMIIAFYILSYKKGDIHES